MQSQLIKLFCLLSIFCFGNFSIAERPFATEKKPPLESNKISFTIKKPKAPKGSTLNDSLSIQGCWTFDRVKSVKVIDKNKKSVKFSRSKDKKSYSVKKLSTIKFPLKATVTFTTNRTLVPRGSIISAFGKTKCTKVTKNGKTKEDCSAAIPVSVRNAVSGVQCITPADVVEQQSSATIALSDGDQLSIRNKLQPLSFSMIGGTFNPNISDTSIILNDELIDPSLVSLQNGFLIANKELTDGLNSIFITTKDQDDHQVVGEFTVWAGSSSLSVNVLDENGQPSSSGVVTLSIGDNSEVKESKNYSNGTVVFENVPSVTIALKANSSDGKSGFSAVAGGDGSATVSLIPFLTESPTVNNDFSLGLDGWAVGANSVTLIPHTEDEPAALPARLRDGVPDQDLVLRTSGEGTRVISRTFRTNPKSRLVRVRYRFQTNEYPGGYFGSRYNDFYNVSLRSSGGAGILDDGSSMNALGRGAFSPNGYTVWKSTLIPVNRSNSNNQQQGEVVQVSAAVANVADGALDSRVIIDKVEESPFAITSASLYDIDNTKLEFISGSRHSYFQGFTHINGTITLEGEEQDAIDSLSLFIMDGQNQVAEAKLSTQANNKLKGKFGKARKKEIKSPMLLFKVFPNELEKLQTLQDKNYTLRIIGHSKNGHRAESSVGSATGLVIFDAPPSLRYDGRDENVGGDDWMLPSVKSKANSLAVSKWGDFSNMNGGNFVGHTLHRNGRSADAWIDGYNALNGDTARALIALLNSPGGNNIRFLYAAFNRSEGSEFFRTISGVRLENGRKASDVILPDSGHRTHFHIEFR